MDAKELSIDQAGQGQTVKELHYHIIDFLIVLDQTSNSVRITFHFEVKVTSQLAAFVVSSQHYHRLGVGNLEAEQQDQNFDRKASSVNIISQK